MVSTDTIKCEHIMLTLDSLSGVLQISTFPLVNSQIWSTSNFNICIGEYYCLAYSTYLVNIITCGEYQLAKIITKPFQVNSLALAAIYIMKTRLYLP